MLRKIVNSGISLALLAVLTMLWGLGTAWAESEETVKMKKGILLVAFGTSVPEAKKGIDSLETAAKKAFPDIEVRMAYTSNIIRRKLKKEQNVSIPTPPEALAAMNDEGFTHVFVQPMHVIPGEEYDVLKSVVDGYASMEGKYAFADIVLGRPFLSDGGDCEAMAEILVRRFEKTPSDTVVVLMGHGTHHMANAMYSAMQLTLSRVSDRFFLGTVEAAPTFEDTLKAIRKTQYKKVVLAPFMVVAGDHAMNDLAGEDDPESWLNMFKKEGFSVETSLSGIGEYPEIAELFTSRLGELMK